MLGVGIPHEMLFLIANVLWFFIVSSLFYNWLFQENSLNYLTDHSKLFSEHVVTHLFISLLAICCR